MLAEAGDHPGRKRDVSPTAFALKAPALPLVKLFTNEHPRSTTKLEVLPAKADGLGDPKARVGEELKEESPVLRHGREHQGELGPRQGLGVLLIDISLKRRWNADPGDGIGPQYAVLDGRGEKRRESGSQQSKRRRRHAPLSEVAVKGPDVSGLDIAQPPGAPILQYVIGD